MSRYHINPATGVPGRCSAEKSCPFGLPLDGHYASEAAAREAYESLMGANTVKSFARTRAVSTASYPIGLDSMLDIELLNRMIATQHLLVSKHPDDDSLKVLCYTPKVQSDGKWNEVTKQARGLIVQSSDEKFGDAVVIQRPWRKFFTLTQLEQGWALGDEENTSSAASELQIIDFNAPAEVTDKMDGSMGVLYRAPDGMPALSTKGSFKSEPAINYTEMIRRNDNFHEAAERLLTEKDDTTFIFELVGKNNQIVLEYDRDDISMIGAIRKSDGLYSSTDDHKDIWSPDNGLTVADRMSANTLAEALQIPDRENREGLVIRMISDDPEKQFQIKVKQEDYKKLHSIMTYFSKNKARETVRNTPATYGDLLKVAETGDVKLFPSIAEQIDIPGDAPQIEKIRKSRLEFFNDNILPKARKIADAKKFVDEIPDEVFEGDERAVNKSFFMRLAAENDENLDRSLVMRFFKGKLMDIDPMEQDAMREMWDAVQK